MIKNKNRYSKPVTTFSNNIWMYRKKRGLSQKQVAYLMGHKSAAHISHYERGLKIPNLRNAIKLEVVLGGVFVSFLFHEMTSQIRKEVHARRIKINLDPPAS